MSFRTYSNQKRDDGGAGDSQGEVSLLFGCTTRWPVRDIVLSGLEPIDELPRSSNCPTPTHLAIDLL